MQFRFAFTVTLFIRLSYLIELVLLVSLVVVNIMFCRQ